LEVAAPGLFATGIAVAPPTDWRYYDTMYTERYMQIPGANQQGYDRTAIREMVNINQLKKLLICHGTADGTLYS